MKKVRLMLTDPGKIVPDPRTGKPVSAEGVKVAEPLSRYWRRRLRDGDVKVAEAPALAFDFGDED